MIMKIEDIAKAMYFLNAIQNKYLEYIDVKQIENNTILLSNNIVISIPVLVNCYNNYVRTGKVVKPW